MKKTKQILLRVIKLELYLQSDFYKKKLCAAQRRRRAVLCFVIRAGSVAIMHSLMPSIYSIILTLVSAIFKDDPLPSPNFWLPENTPTTNIGEFDNLPLSRNILELEVVKYT